MSAAQSSLLFLSQCLSVSLDIMEAFGRQNKPVLTVLTDLVAVLTDLTVSTALIFQILGVDFEGVLKKLGFLAF